MVARGNHIRGVTDGIFTWSDNFLVEDNYLHDFSTNGGNGHVDGFQTEGTSHGIIRHNVFEVEQGQTSAIAVWNSAGNSSDFQIENNLIAGGGFSIYAEDYSQYSVTNIRYVNNKFSNALYQCVGAYGVWFNRGAPTDGWNRLGNVVLETQQNIDSKNPVVGGWECQ